MRRVVAAGVLVAAAYVPATADARVSAAGDCTPAGVRAALASFVAAFDRGDSAQLDALFAPKPAFRWYSSNAPGTRLGSDAANRASLVAYFERRHRLGDRLRLLSFRFNANANGYGHFAFVMRRSARDYRRGAPFTLPGKGAAVCTESEPRVQFVVLSLGGPRAA